METAAAHPQESGHVLARFATVARRESGLFRIGVGLIAVHILDDSFLQPEHGTSARDHVISGLVPTLALLAAAWSYPRLRAGARATLALLLGFFGLVAGGSEGGYHLVTVGVSGDDYTGLLALFGGLVLVTLGAVQLWRTRRLDESRRRRYLRRSLVTIAAAILGFAIVFPRILRLRLHPLRPLVRS
jgi:hypothetical protein